MRSNRWQRNVGTERYRLLLLTSHDSDRLQWVQSIGPAVWLGLDDDRSRDLANLQQSECQRSTLQIVRAIARRRQARKSTCQTRNPRAIFGGLPNVQQRVASSAVEHSAFNRLVPSSNLGRPIFKLTTTNKNRWGCKILRIGRIPVLLPEGGIVDRDKPIACLTIDWEDSREYR
jgi:hypothetical protein